MSDDLDTFGDLIEFPSVSEKKGPGQIDVGEMDIDDEASLGEVLHSFGMLKKSTGQQLMKPWMKFHRFVRVKTVDEVRDIVDRALQNGFCALDLETEGFDNRIDYTDSGQPYTKHQIVGFCLAVKGVGYYIPVRHSFDPEEESDPNVSVAGVEAEIRRLCLASQPKLTPEGLDEDPLGSRKIEAPPQVVIAFWHSKFDQEFLYPITGIDAWHPHSFEDGYLAAYTLYTDDKTLGLKDKAEQKLRIQDPEERGPDGKPVWHAYEMIHFDDLFLKGMKRSEKRFQDLRPDENSDVVLYGCSDGICTELLCEQRKVAWELTKEGLTYEYDNVVSPVQINKFKDIYRLEKQTVQSVRVVERARAKIDHQEITTLLAEARKERLEYEEKIVSFASTRGFKNFNPGSPQQLSDFLFSKKGLDITPKPAENKTPGQYKTDASTLEKLFEAKPDVEVLSWVVKYRQVDKIIGTYLESLVNNCDENSCLRFQFKQTGAATGRFTAPAGDPEHGYAGIPPQGIPGKVDPKRPKVANSLRRMFVARDGYTLVKIDYAGQELRIVANLSGEPVWIDEFLHGDGDLHTITARAFFGNHITKENKTERNKGKVANFALIYGGGVQAIQRAVGCDEAEAARKKASFDASVPTFAKWVKKQHAYVKENLGIKTAFGRFISIPDAAVREGDKIGGALVDRKMVHKIRAACERKSTNFPIQGSGADILKISLVLLLRELHKRKWLRNGGDDSVRMILTVHDEIVFEIQHDRLQQAVPVISSIMESPSSIARGWKVPLVVEPLLGKTWDAKYDWDKIMAGKEPVPDWLQGHLVPGAAREGIQKSQPQSSTVEVTPPTNRETLPEQPKSLPKAAPLTVASPQSNVVEFRIPYSLMTRESVLAVKYAIREADPVLTEGAACTLKLLDSNGNLLIRPEDGKVVDPRRFSLELRLRNLGPGRYQS